MPITTQLVRVDPARPDPDVIARAVDVLRAGGLVAFPTETVYGLGAHARDPQAVARIFTAKGRPASDPLIVHIASIDQLAGVARDVPPIAYELARRFWPGPLTLVLARHPAIPASVSAGLDSVAVRVPSHPVAQALLVGGQLPIAAPSANRFARPSPTSAAHVLDDLRGRVDLVLDGGVASIGVESSVLDLTGSHPRLLRPGGVPLETLRALLPDLAFVPRYVQEGEAASAPGGLLKHYSPDAPLTLVEGASDAIHAYFWQQAHQYQRAGTTLGLLVADDDLAAISGIPAHVIALGPLADLEQVAAALFAGLRNLDALQPAAILARSFGQHGLGLAIGDRLIRAAEGRLISLPAHLAQ